MEWPRLGAAPPPPRLKPPECGALDPPKLPPRLKLGMLACGAGAAGRLLGARNAPMFGVDGRCTVLRCCGSCGMDANRRACGAATPGLLRRIWGADALRSICGIAGG